MVEKKRFSERVITNKELFVARTNTFLRDLGFKDKLLNNNNFKEKITPFLGEHIFDREFLLPLPVAGFSQDSPLGSFEQEYFTRSREPLYVISGVYLESLREAGGNVICMVDINNLYGANKVNAVPKDIIGDYLLHDVVEKLIQNLGDNYYVVRCDGDEFAIVQRPNISVVNIPSHGDIQNYAQQAKGLFLVGQNVELTNASVKIRTQVPIDLEKRDTYLGFSTEDRKRRLIEVHPETQLVLDTIEVLKDEEVPEQKLFRLIEDGLYDPLLQEKSEVLSNELGLEILVYRDKIDFLEHLQSQEAAYSMLRVDVPGVLKAINDDESLGYGKGNIFLNWEFERIISALAPILKKNKMDKNGLRVYRKGGDFYIVLQEIDQETSLSIAKMITNRLQGYYDLTSAKKIPIIATCVTHDFPIDTEDILANRNQFLSFNETTTDEVWLNNLDAIKKRYKFNIFDDDWLFLAELFNPLSKRGLLRLLRLNIKERQINKLIDCYPQTIDADEHYLLDLSAFKIDQFIPLMKSILYPRTTRRGASNSSY